MLLKTIKKNNYEGLWKIIKAFLIILAFVAVIWKIYEKDRDKKIVVNNFGIATGRIVDYSIKGQYQNRMLNYTYKVDDVVYRRKMTPNVIFDSCQANIYLCSELRFIVIYSKEFPDKSLIDLTRQVQDLDTLILPESFKNFK